MSYGQYPYGLSQIVITDQDGFNAINLPTGIMLHFTEEITSEDFTVEGVRAGSNSFTSGVSWEIEAGGISLPAYAKLTGRTAVMDSGTTPSRSSALAGITNEAFPYVRIYGRAKDDTGGDLYCKIFRAKLTAIEGTFRNKQFWVTSCAGVASKDPTYGFYELVQHETSLVIAAG